MARQFTMERQDETNWCWLAAAVSVADFFANGAYAQCRLAGQLVTALPPGTRCCTNPAPGACNQPGYPSAALSHVGHSQGSYASLAPFVDIENEVRKGNPVVLRLVYAGSGVSHVIVVVDAFVQGTREFLKVEDPDGPFQRIIPYNGGLYRNVAIAWGRTYYTCP